MKPTGGYWDHSMFPEDNEPVWVPYGKPVRESDSSQEPDRATSGGNGAAEQGASRSPMGIERALRLFSAAWQQVTCSGCGREYQCVPADDYYHRPEVTNADRTLSNGVCEPCLLGFRGKDDPFLRRPQGLSGSAEPLRPEVAPNPEGGHQ